MEFNEGAKSDIEKNLKEITNNINLDEKDRTDIEKELRSTYYEAAEAAARARGSDTVTIDDVKTARAEMCSPKVTAESYMKSYASTLGRAGFWPRLVAYIIDNIVIGATMILLALPILLLILILNIPLSDTPVYTWDHSALALVIFIAVAIVTAVSMLVVALGYYIVLEGHFGYTIGKYLLGLRVLKTDGTRIGYKEAFLRNLSKYINNLIVIDALIMLIFFNKEKQRGFDKIANTMVVHARSR
ncbi:MAG TPA: RDD family protein [Methanocellaceae archaeon]